MCRSWSDVGLFVGSCVNLRKELVLLVRIELGGVNHIENLSTISFGSKDPIFIYLDLFSLIVFHITLLNLLEDMTRNSQFTVKTVNSHPSKINVVKFDGTNNYGMWRCEVTVGNS